MQCEEFSSVVLFQTFMQNGVESLTLELVELFNLYTYIPMTISNISTLKQACVSHQCDVSGGCSCTHMEAGLANGAAAIQGPSKCPHSSVTNTKLLVQLTVGHSVL